MPAKTARPSPVRKRSEPLPAAVPGGAAAESVALRAFSVLECVARAAQPLSLDDITQQLGLPKPTVFRILGLLKGAGLLQRDALSKRFTAGPRLTSFGVDLWRNASLRLQWHRALQIAVVEAGETCNITMLDKDQVLYIDRVETHQPLRLHLDVGTRVPLHCTAAGKLFLSVMSPAELRAVLGPEPFERFTPKTITTLKALQTELERTRLTGVGIHDSELFADSVAVAVPVLDAHGRTFAAVAMHAPASRVSLRAAMTRLPVLTKAAQTIAATLADSPTEPGSRPGRLSTAAQAARPAPGAGVPAPLAARAPRR